MTRKPRAIPAPTPPDKTKEMETAEYAHWLAQECRRLRLAGSDASWVELQRTLAAAELTLAEYPTA